MRRRLLSLGLFCLLGLSAGLGAVSGSSAASPPAWGEAFVVNTAAAAPDTAIDHHPADPTTLTGATFTFSSTVPGSTFECDLDDGGFSACTSPAHYSGLSGGSHTFQVRAISGAETDATPASFSWTISLLETGTTTCNGTYAGTGSFVIVRTGATCTLVPGTHVTVSVTVRAGGTLLATGVRIGGSLAIKGSATVCHSRIRLDVKARFPLGSLELGGPSCLKGNTIGHDLLVNNADNRLWIWDNNVANSLNVRNSHGATDSIVRNTVGNLLVAHSGPVLVRGNRANNGTLRCVDDKPLTGSHNRALSVNTCPR